MIGLGSFKYASKCILSKKKKLSSIFFISFYFFLHETSILNVKVFEMKKSKLNIQGLPYNL